MSQYVRTHISEAGVTRHTHTVELSLTHKHACLMEIHPLLRSMFKKHQREAHTGTDWEDAGLQILLRKTGTVNSRGGNVEVSVKMMDE